MSPTEPIPITLFQTFCKVLMDHVGSCTWRDASYRTIRLAQDLQLRPHSAATPTNNRQGLASARDGARSMQRECATPPAYQRDLIAQTSNALALSYMRDAQGSMFCLRQALLEADRHIQRLQRERDILERTHANVRRDLVAHQETCQLRSQRPKRERYPDKANPLLREEKTGLLEKKKNSEHQLHEVSRQLKVLYRHRQKLWEFCKEKSSVLEVLGESAHPPPTGKATTGASKHLWQDNTDCRAAIDNTYDTCHKFRNTQPLNGQKPSDQGELMERVTKALRKKAGESAQIREDLTLCGGDSRKSIHRQQRFQNEIEASYQLHLGPVCNTDITTRESVTRPLVKILQRHPVTQLPECTLISETSATLQQKLSSTRDRLGLLQLTRQRLKKDADSKLWGERMDRAAVRLRERSARTQRLIL
ncbi:tektin-like protein 1 [Pelodytes ibericus]